MLLLISILTLFHISIRQKSFVQEMSKHCVIQNLNFGGRSQFLGWLFGFGSKVLDFTFWLLGLNLESQVKDPGP